MKIGNILIRKDRLTIFYKFIVFSLDPGPKFHILPKVVNESSLFETNWFFYSL